MVTISNEDGRLVIVHKPTVAVQTRRETFFGCVMPILVLVVIMVFSLTMSFFRILRNEGKESAHAFLMVIAIAVAGILLGSVILDLFSNPKTLRNLPKKSPV